MPVVALLNVEELIKYRHIPPAGKFIYQKARINANRLICCNKTETITTEVKFLVENQTSEDLTFPRTLLRSCPLPQLTAVRPILNLMEGWQ